MHSREPFQLPILDVKTFSLLTTYKDLCTPTRWLQLTLRGQYNYPITYIQKNNTWEEFFYQKQRVGMRRV